MLNIRILGGAGRRRVRVLEEPREPHGVQKVPEGW